MARKRWTKRILWSLSISLGIGLVIGLFLWLAAIRIPAWYVPPDVPEAEYQNVRDSLTQLYADVSDQLIRRKTFEIEIHGEQVSQWLAIRASIWAESEDWLPPGLSDPVVVFQDDGIDFGVRAENNGLQSIANVRIVFNVEKEWITVRLDRVALGSLSLPPSLIAEPLDDVLSAEGADVDVMPDLMSDAVRRIREDGGERLFTEGYRIENHFEWQNGRRWFRITESRIENNTLYLAIEPE